MADFLKQKVKETQSSLKDLREKIQVDEGMSQTLRNSSETYKR
jgi:hypothetical protein